MLVVGFTVEFTKPSVYYSNNKDIKPTIEESQQFNYELFSKAEEYKTIIKELMIMDNT